MITAPSALSALAPEEVLRNYFHAKDENRPHVLERVFSSEAELVISNFTSTISFPAVTMGRDAISEVLVCRFAQSYENVYSFYLHHPPPTAGQFSCGWLVLMSEKETKSPRVGCGRYEWEFASNAPCLATRLHITILAMQVLLPGDLPAVLRWAAALDYPWCTIETVLQSAPNIPSLQPVIQHVASLANGA